MVVSDLGMAVLDLGMVVSGPGQGKAVYDKVDKVGNVYVCEKKENSNQ